MFFFYIYKGSQACFAHFLFEERTQFFGTSTISFGKMNQVLLKSAPVSLNIERSRI